MESQDKFCPSCAARLHLREVSGTERPMCPQCQRVIYHDPKVAAIAVVERGGQVLLVRRDNQPGYGRWSMPGGYVDRGVSFPNFLLPCPDPAFLASGRISGRISRDWNPLAGQDVTLRVTRI